MKRKAHFQRTLSAQTGFEKYARKSRREEFLSGMDVVVPWRELEALIEPQYPKAGNGRQPVGLSIMLRVYFLQQWFNLSDPGAEDALYESPVLRRFRGLIWAVLQRPTRLRFFVFAACWRSMNCAARFWIP
jgi:transposase, IS5 family